MNKGFNGPLTDNHKIVSTKGGADGNIFGKNTGKTGIGLSSNSKAAINPTSDTDDKGMGRTGRAPSYGKGNRGGASGDGATPGYGNGPSEGNHSFDGAQGGNAKRSLAY